MILPLAPFLLFAEPELLPTQSPPLVMNFLAKGPSDQSESLEICFDAIRYVDINIDSFERKPVVSIGLTPDAASRLAQMSLGRIGEKSSLTIAGTVVLEPVLNESLTTGSFILGGLDTIAHAEQLRQAALGQCTVRKAEAQ